MSSNVLKIIPQDPYFVPTQEAMELVAEELTRYLSKRKEDIKVITTDKVRFVDPGSNLREIQCPFCCCIIDFDWWQEAMDQLYEEKFKSLAIETPCCYKITSLNNLIYDWTAGFARFSIEVLDPNGDITQEQQKVLETILGYEIRKIWSHY